MMDRGYNGHVPEGLREVEVFDCFGEVVEEAPVRN